MAFFYSQPIAHRFGTALQYLLREARWTHLNVAVAWVRRSGMEHLRDDLRAFLSRGCQARFIVGVDIENTSIEGLQELLTLQSAGNLEVFVHHNEASPTYHPKIYLFESDNVAHLIVGSNNLTEAGLFRNTEAGLEVEVPKDDPVIAQVRAAIDSWSDPASPLVRRLDDSLLKALVQEGYVLPEKKLRERRRESSANAKAGKVHTPLFGSLVVSAPAAPPYSATKPSVAGGLAPTGGTAAASSQAPAQGTVLLMRVRRASETGRRNQIQIPIALAGTRFFGGVADITSTHDGRSHTMRPARAHGTINTIKIDIPEIGSMHDPVMRLERTPSGLVYEAYDSASAQGSQIVAKLQEGMESGVPNPTVLTFPSDPQRSTWYRFI